MWWEGDDARGSRPHEGVSPKKGAKAVLRSKIQQ